MRAAVASIAWTTAALAVGFVLAPWAGAAARDFGAMGQTWSIAEPDLLATIQGRLASMQANGGIARMQRDLAAKAEARVRRPDPVAGLSAATEPRRWLHDPAIVVEADIRDQNGRPVAMPRTSLGRPAAGRRLRPRSF